ncbi:MAG: hypothetical protein JSW24_04525 [Dehalococcoidia bacterium]|nr:MAG: hypothetical protein JSW24_04525 [Dehalococcoidia bacterium]
MKVMKIVGVSALAVGLVLGLASPALAAPPNRVPLQVSQMPPRLLVGEVVNVDEGKTFFVIQSGLQEVTVSVDGDTQYYEAPIPWRAIPPVRRMVELRQESQERLGLKNWLRSFVGKAGSLFKALVPWGVPGLVRQQLELRQPAVEEPGLGRWLCPLAEEATFDDLAVGSHVVVRALPGEDSPLAKLVIIIEPIGYGRVVGTITDISLGNKTITIDPIDEDGEITLSYNERTRFILCGIPGLEVGQSIRAIYDEDMTANLVFAPVAVSSVAE